MLKQLDQLTLSFQAQFKVLVTIQKKEKPGKALPELTLPSDLPI